MIALVSVASFGFAIYQWRATHGAALRVVNGSDRIIERRSGKVLSEGGFAIRAVNRSNRRVVIDGCGLEVNGDEHFLVPDWSDPAIPCPLDRHGDDLMIWYSPDSLRRFFVERGYPSAVRLRGWVRDSTSKRHKGNLLRSTELL